MLLTLRMYLYPLNQLREFNLYISFGAHRLVEHSPRISLNTFEQHIISCLTELNLVASVFVVGLKLGSTKVFTFKLDGSQQVVLGKLYQDQRDFSSELNATFQFCQST